MAQEFQGKPRDEEYFNALAQRLESEGYVNEGDQARAYGQQFRKTESEIRTSEKGEEVVEATASNIQSDTAQNTKVTGWYDQITKSNIKNVDATTKSILAKVTDDAERLGMDKQMLDGKIKNLYAQAGLTDAQTKAIPHATFAKYADIAIRKEQLDEDKRNGLVNRDTAQREVAIAEELQDLRQQTQDFSEKAETERLKNEGVKLGIDLADLTVRQDTAMANIGLTRAETEAVPQRIKNEQSRIIIAEKELQELTRSKVASEQIARRQNAIDTMKVELQADLQEWQKGYKAEELALTAEKTYADIGLINSRVKNSDAVTNRISQLTPLEVNSMTASYEGQMIENGMKGFELDQLPEKRQEEMILHQAEVAQIRSMIGSREQADNIQERLAKITEDKFNLDKKIYQDEADKYKDTLSLNKDLIQSQINENNATAAYKLAAGRAEGVPKRYTATETDYKMFGNIIANDPSIDASDESVKDLASRAGNIYAGILSTTNKDPHQAATEALEIAHGQVSDSGKDEWGQTETVKYRDTPVAGDVVGNHKFKGGNPQIQSNWIPL
jgi:hypothetical protein